MQKLTAGLPREQGRMRNGGPVFSLAFPLPWHKEVRDKEMSEMFKLQRKAWLRED